MTDEVHFARQGPLGLITLQRPRALNALSLPMAAALRRQLAAWTAAPDVQAVVIRGAGGRAFCAGGDVRAVHEVQLRVRRGEADVREALAFFREEYLLNRAIHTCPKPWVALVDGICMGGGLGLSVHGSHRVVTERLVLAMPETAIGLFPDVGGGWFLPRFPGQTGTYLGLTGARCDAADAHFLGYATHQVPSSRLEDAVEALAGADWAGPSAHQVVDAALAPLAVPAGPSALAARQPDIDRLFAPAQVEDILAGLAREATPWAEQTRTTLERMCPFSLKVTLALLRRGRTLSHAEVVPLEYRLMQACIAREDFHEGIRAVLVEKHGQPQWRPARLADVDAAEVEAAFRAEGKDALALD